MLWMKYGSRFFILRVHKFFKKISTHLLTVLIMCAIVQIEQRKRDKRKGIPDVRRTRNDNTADWIVKIQGAFERRYDLC